jgi:hypothetical protein
LSAGEGGAKRVEIEYVNQTRTSSLSMLLDIVVAVIVYEDLTCFWGLVVGSKRLK